LQPPPLPAACRHIYRWFQELSFARGGNGFGPNPIRYVDIAAWSELTGSAIRPGEVRAILRLDQVYLTELAKRTPKPKPKPKADKPPPRRR
jgi:hypothetical protein